VVPARSNVRQHDLLHFVMCTCLCSQLLGSSVCAIMLCRICNIGAQKILTLCHAGQVKKLVAFSCTAFSYKCAKSLHWERFCGMHRVCMCMCNHIFVSNVCHFVRTAKD